MKVEKISQANANHASCLPRNVNMTGFGTSETKEQISSLTDSKANEAIRSNFLANVSFNGHTRSFNVQRSDHDEPVMVDRPVYYNRGTSGAIIGYEKVQAYSRTVTSYKVGDKWGSNLNDLVRNAIVSAPDYEGGVIVEGDRHFDISRSFSSAPNRKELSVYYAHRGEEIFLDKFKANHFVVMPDNSRISPFNNFMDQDEKLNGYDADGPDGMGFSWV